MREPKKIVIILGNGFDLDLGRKTSYKDFWDSEFCPKDYPAPIIRHLNNHWGDDIKSLRWYDLENELLTYAKADTKTDIINDIQRSYIKNHTDYELTIASRFTGTDEVFSSLVKLGVIQTVGVLKSSVIPYRDDLLRDATWRDRKAYELIKERLCQYLKSIAYKPIKEHSVAFNVLLAANCAKELGDFLSIYSFNFTQLPIKDGNDFQSEVHFVHGNCNNGKIIIGTRDDDNYCKKYDFLQKSFDPNFNPPALVADLLDADNVIIFGHSLGDNDIQYFKSFFKKQTDVTCPNKKDITVFTLDDKTEIDIKRSLQKMTDYNLSTLYGVNHVHIIKTATLKENPLPFCGFLEQYVLDESKKELIMNNLFQQQ